MRFKVAWRLFQMLLWAIWIINTGISQAISLSWPRQVWFVRAFLSNELRIFRFWQGIWNLFLLYILQLSFLFVLLIWLPNQMTIVKYDCVICSFGGISIDCVEILCCITLNWICRRGSKFDHWFCKFLVRVVQIWFELFLFGTLWYIFLCIYTFIRFLF